ncbi:MAG TPA: type II secretion system F family protein [Candidatus Saccharimonadales bacterium]|jgi:tight adherence protein C|nr:type II secretion system F family protein [Candidatus Saccharimonadales bacterium]
MELIIAVGFFGVISGLVYFVLASRSPVADEAIQRRLESIGVQAQSRGPIRLHDDEETTMWERVANFFFGDKEMPDRFSGISRRLHQAGYRGHRAIRIFWGLRLFLCMALGFGSMLLAWISQSSMKDFLMLGGFAALVGYMLPFITIYRKARTRVREMRETLPDALDLIVVCVEAGMGVDAALNRVGREQNEQGLALGEELLLATQEMQAGSVRKEALTRLAERVGVDEFRGLVTFLTQTEEMGGSIARSLRVYAETMRDKRSQAAEEAARKTVIKLIFPLVFFILPAIFIILLGPPGLGIMEMLSDPLH